MGLIDDLLSMVFPRVCEICGTGLVEGERILCLDCLAAMPRCSFHLDEDSPFTRRMAAAKIEKNAVMFPYVKQSPYAKLIQLSKYNHRPDIDIALAETFAAQLGTPFFSDMDLLLPVPMHWFKKLRRGFNQTELIAEGIARVTGLPIGDNLVARKSHPTQTRKSALQRVLNTSDVFSTINPHELHGKHVLIIDDVITTGSTVLACAETLRASVGADLRISVLTLAAAHRN